ncbi:MAG: two-component regulator propeller domain-containing protein [Candidatus Sulfotelmatobacter sp.]|jgi:signal transduction histidine kinase/ligand-binding sensor domain-containing protein
MNRCLTLFGHNMGNIAPRQPLLLRFSWSRMTTAAALVCHLTCIVLLAGTVHALDPNKRLTQYMHTSWRIQDGSAPSGIEAIAQTLDGYLWFSSDSQGLYRFDGVRFLPWTLSSNGKTINKIVNVYGDHAGGLWVLGEREIVHLKGGVVTSHFNVDGLQQFQQISEDPDGSLWVVRRRVAGSDAPLCRITDGAVKCFGKSDGVPISPADSLLADGKGGFWLGGQTALAHWHDGVSEAYPIEALNSNVGQLGIVSLAAGREGALWVGMMAEGRGLGLGRLIGGIVKPFVTPTFDGSKVVVNAMISDRDGNLWVGTLGKGIFRIHDNVVDHYQQTDGLSSDSVLALFEDREGIVWTVTTNGIDSFRDPSVTTFSAREGLGTDAAAGVLASRDGTIWVANAGSLDQIKDGTVSSIRTGSGLPGHQVTAMLEDRAGNLWVGVDDGLYLFKSGRFRRLPEPNNQPLGMVVGMTEDNDGDIWAECLSNPRKLVRIRDFQVREEYPASQIPPGHSLASDPHGGIWIATKKGDVALFRNGVLETKFPLNPGGDPSNRQIMSTADGSILAGSENGLVEWRQGKVHRMTTKNGLPCNSVISFIEDKENRWWLHTGCGVVQLPDSELERWRANPEAVVQTRVYDVLDGARPAGGPSFNAAAHSSDGRVWFATGFVVEMVGPSRLSKKALPAQAYIESFVADRKEFKATPNLKVPPNPRDLQIDYTSPTFSIPQKVNFRYRLDGYDRDWHEAGKRRQAFYTDLPPGKYSFRVIACNSDGVWNESAAKLDFSIAPAYYQTNWFRALCAAAFLASLWAAYQLRVRQLRREFNTAIEARVSERTRIARELHDTLLQSLQALLFQYQAARNLFAAGSERAMQVLDASLDRTEQAIAESRDAIRDIRSDIVAQTALPELLTRTGSELAQSQADQDVPTFGLTVEGEQRTLTPIIREETYRIALELLRNAFRHAKAHRIETEIRYDDDTLRLRIRDDGKGMDLKVLQGDSSGHWGLRGVRERAQRIGAKLDVWSEAGAGAEFQLTVPAGIAYVGSGDSLPFRLLRKVRGYAYRN